MALLTEGGTRCWDREEEGKRIVLYTLHSFHPLLAHQHHAPGPSGPSSSPGAPVLPFLDQGPDCWMKWSERFRNYSNRSHVTKSNAVNSSHSVVQSSRSQQVSQNTTDPSENSVQSVKQSSTRSPHPVGKVKAAKRKAKVMSLFNLYTSLSAR